MRVALALIALTGCSQIFGLSDPARAGTSDAPLADTRGADGTTDVGSDASLPECDASAADLIACFGFEGTFDDQSSVATPVTGLNASFVAGQRGSAAYVGASSMITLGASNVFNVSSVTMEMWVNPDALPATGSRAGLFDSDARYGVFVHGDGSVASRATNTAPGVIVVGAWTHIAVTDDGVTRVFYINGIEAVVAASTAVPMSSGTTEIGGNAPTGDRFLGAIDSLRVFNSAHDAQQICAAAGC